MDAIKLDLVGDRGLWFVSDPLVFVGEDFTDATMRMQVRQHPDSGGTANATMTGPGLPASQGIHLDYADTATLAEHRSADRISAEDLAALLQKKNPDTGVNYQESDSVLLSIITIRIANTVMAAMPAAAKLGDDIDLAYDLLIQLTGAKEAKRIYGKFTVRGTVTQ